MPSCTRTDWLTDICSKSQELNRNPKDVEDFEREFEACLVTKFLDRLGAWGRNPDHEHIENHCYMAWLIVLEFPLSQCVFFKCYGLKDLVFCNVVVVFGPVYYRTRKSLLVSGKVLPESVYKTSLQDLLYLDRPMAVGRKATFQMTEKIWMFCWVWSHDSIMGSLRPNPQPVEYTAWHQCQCVVLLC